MGHSAWDTGHKHWPGTHIGEYQCLGTGVAGEKGIASKTSRIRGFVIYLEGNFPNRAGVGGGWEGVFNPPKSKRGLISLAIVS